MKSPTGFDVSYGFLFSVKDDELRDTLIKTMSLEPMSQMTRRPISFIDSRPPTWWLGDSQFDEWYGRIDETAERYWSLRVDHDGGKLQYEYGRW